MIGVSFSDYIKAQEELDEIFSTPLEFCRRIMTTMSNLWTLQIDQSIRELCEKVWKIPSVEVPKPSLNATQRVRSSSNLLSMSHEELNSRGESLGDDEDDIISGNGTPITPQDVQK